MLPIVLCGFLCREPLIQPHARFYSTYTMRRNEDPCRDPASEARDDWADRELSPTPDALNVAIGDHLFELLGDPNNLEGSGPTDEERAANAKAISDLTVPERFALMFRGTNPES